MFSGPMAVSCGGDGGGPWVVVKRKLGKGKI